MTGSKAPLPAVGPEGLEIVSITPEPSESERAAIVAAVEALQSELRLRPDAAAMPAPSPRWRYAGRRWQRRDRYGGWV